MFYLKACQVEQYSTTSLRFQETQKNDGNLRVLKGAADIYLKEFGMSIDTEDTNGERIKVLADHDAQLREEMVLLQSDYNDAMEFMSYLSRVRQAWIDFHNAAAVLRNYYMDDDDEGKLNEFLMGGIRGSSKRLNDLEDEINVQHEAMSVIRGEIRYRREELR